MANQAPRVLINGLFTKIVWTDPADPARILLSQGFKRDEFIKELMKLPVNPRGFVDITLSTQRADKKKLTAFYQEYTPSGGNANKTFSQQPASQQPAPASPSSPTDDLPF